MAEFLPVTAAPIRDWDQLYVPAVIRLLGPWMTCLLGLLGDGASVTLPHYILRLQTARASSGCPCSSTNTSSGPGSVVVLYNK